MNNMQKTLSIIIPTYNMEKYLRKCLSSLLTGSLSDMLEVLVVNDGSKDGSLKIAMEFEEKHPGTFRAIDKPNGNYGSCINRGLAEARGRYVKVLDADDTYDTTALETLLKQLQKTDADIVITDYMKVDGQGRETRAHSRRLPAGRLMQQEELFRRTLGEKIEMHEITYRTENLRRIGYKQTEGISYTDQEWTFLPMTTVRTAYYLPICVYRYLVGRAGQTVDSSASHRLQSNAEKTMFTQIAAFNYCTGLAPALRQYLVAHLRTNINFIYRTYLIYSYTTLPISGLKNFDTALQQANRELYDLMDSETVHSRIPLRFIRQWRRDKDAVPAAVKAYRSIVFPLLRRLGKA